MTPADKEPPAGALGGVSITTDAVPARGTASLPTRTTHMDTQAIGTAHLAADGQVDLLQLSPGTLDAWASTLSPSTLAEHRDQEQGEGGGHNKGVWMSQKWDTARFESLSWWPLSSYPRESPGAVEGSSEDDTMGALRGDGTISIGASQQRVGGESMPIGTFRVSRIPKVTRHPRLPAGRG